MASSVCSHVKPAALFMNLGGENDSTGWSHIVQKPGLHHYLMYANTGVDTLPFRVLEVRFSSGWSLQVWPKACKYTLFS